MENVVPIAGLLPAAAARAGPQLVPKELRRGTKSKVNVPNDAGPTSWPLAVVIRVMGSRGSVRGPPKAHAFALREPPS